MDQDNFNQLKTAYDACMDEETIKKKGIKPLREILSQVAEMFPVEGSEFRQRTASQSKGEEDLADTILYLFRIGVSSVLSCATGADDKDPDVVVVQCGPPYRIGLPAKDYYNDDDLTQKYESTLAQVFYNLDPDLGDATLLARWTGFGRHNVVARGKSEDIAHDVVRFEKQLAAASPDAEDADDVTVSFVVSLCPTMLIDSRNTTILGL